MSEIKNNQPVILHGRSHPEFAETLASTLSWQHIPVEVSTFSDSEVHTVIQEDVTGRDVYIVQPTSAPANDHLMELLFIAGAARDHGAKRITAVMPFFGYRRQEKITTHGEVLSFSVIAQLMKAVGIDRVMVLDLHKHRSSKFFTEVGIECVELSASSLFVEYFKNHNDGNLVILAPDKGSVPGSAEYAQALGIPMIIAKKRRYVDQKDHAFFDELIADVADKNILIIDDEVNTAGTLVGVVDIMKQQGANNIFVACTHGVLSGPAIERLAVAPITEFILTDSIARSPEQELPLFKTISVIPLFAKALQDWQ